MVVKDFCPTSLGFTPWCWEEELLRLTQTECRVTEGDRDQLSPRTSPPSPTPSANIPSPKIRNLPDSAKLSTHDVVWDWMLLYSNNNVMLPHVRVCYMLWTCHP